MDIGFAAWAGLVGAVIGGLLTALLQPWWATVLSRPPRLTATISLTSIEPPERLKELISDWLWNSKSEGPKKEDRDLLDTLRKYKVFSKVTLSNRSKKKLSGVKIGISESYCRFLAEYQRNNQNRTIFNKDVEIGDLHPGERVVVYFWMDTLFARLRDVASYFVITADEYDRIHTEILPSAHDTSDYFYVRRDSLRVIIATILCAIVIVLIMLAYYSYWGKAST